MRKRDGAQRLAHSLALRATYAQRDSRRARACYPVAHTLRAVDNPGSCVGPHEHNPQQHARIDKSGTEGEQADTAFVQRFGLRYDHCNGQPQDGDHAQDGKQH